MRALRQSDDGVAMLFVIAIGLVVTGLVVAMFATVLQTQSSARTQRNITSAQAAAEAGINDAVFKLGQYTGTVSNWSKYGAGGSNQWTQSSPFTPTAGSIGANTSYSVWVTAMSGSSNQILWSRGSYGSDTRLIRAEIKQGSPPAFDFSMFASKGIDIHHHNSYLSPQVWTTSVHSNGYINIDYPAEFTVNSLEAVGNLTFGKNGGSTPGGAIPSTGYNWYDPLNGKCYPGGMAHPGGVTPASPPTCDPSLKYPATATIYGTVKAGSVTLNSHGQVRPAAAATLDTGQTINAQTGTIQAATASIGGTNYTPTNPCPPTVCNLGASAGAGQVSGAVTLKSGYAPDTIAFPSINYSTTYRPKAQAEQDAGGGQHVFTSSGNFLSYITNPDNGLFRTINTSTHALDTWDSTKSPDVIYLNGDYDITSGQAVLNYNTIQNMVNSATHLSGPAPMLVIQGSLVVEGGGIKLSTGLVMVGAGNRLDFLTPATSTTPVTIDTSLLLDTTATMPAVLAAGGSIDSQDYDTDSNWTSSSTYEPYKASPVYIRGLVYSASWDSSTGTSVPQSQHFHNFDPKNLQKIYGAQVGAQLHDCNNFSFSYDPLVQRAFGFGGGTVQVVDYQELGK
jgi:hypothetical protein